MEQFHNKGWLFSEKMAALLPHNPKRQHTYHPGRQFKAADVSIPVASQVEDGPDSQESFMDSQESV